uniref:addiction module antidote protein n=1 Tax=Pararhizobium sp. IMCC3301 TaxID=3067904 RepID=UPI0027415461|nr:addiction module antidote protein [Pararhizobium sp. IMCC3301]
MAIETVPFDAAKHLGEHADQIELISDAMATGDPEYIKNALNVVARARGMTSIAQSAGVSRDTLYKALSGKGDPRMSTLTGVLKALGLRMSVEADPPS